MKIGKVEKVDTSNDLLRGDFICPINKSKIFAIWGGKVGKRKNSDGTLERTYSLICYSNPDYLEEVKAENGIKTYIPKEIFSVPKCLDDPTASSECRYYIPASDISGWRLCEPEEEETALKRLADYGYKWDPVMCELSELANGERLIFNDKKKEGVHTILKKKRQRQSIPITQMNDEQIIELKKACEKYNSTNERSSYQGHPRQSFNGYFRHKKGHRRIFNSLVNSLTSGMTSHNGYFDF